MTADHLPHLHAPAPGVIAALGYNGRGVALATALGLAIGAHLATGARFAVSRLRRCGRCPGMGCMRLYGAAAIRYYRLRDALEA